MSKNLKVACDQTSKEVSLVALCLTLANVLRIRTAKYHHIARLSVSENLTYLEVDNNKNN